MFPDHKASAQPELKVLPPSWREFRKAVARFAGTPAADSWDRFRLELRILLHEALSIPPLPRLDVPQGVPSELIGAVHGALSVVHEQYGQVLEALRTTIEDFRHAAENDDRFVVVVFGEVNSGKSA